MEVKNKAPIAKFAQDSSDSNAAQNGVALLYVFCNEVIDQIDTAISDSLQTNWSLQEIGLDNLYREFEYCSIGCIAMCPLCGQKCDEDVNIVDHKHCCGCHQIRGFGGIKLKDGQASTEICEEIQDNREIYLHKKDKWTTWGEIKLQHQDWQFDNLDADDEEKEDTILHILSDL